MQNKRVVRGNTYAQRVPIRTFNVTSTLDDHGTPCTPGLMQRKFQQRNQILPNLMDGQIQVKLVNNTNYKHLFLHNKSEKFTMHIENYISL